MLGYTLLTPRVKMKISTCNSRRWFRTRYTFSIRSSGLVKANYSTWGIVAFFRTTDIYRGFVTTHEHILLLLLLLLLLKNYLPKIHVSYAPERDAHALKRTCVKTLTQIIWNKIRVPNLENLLSHFLLLSTVLQSV